MRKPPCWNYFELKAIIYGDRLGTNQEQLRKRRYSSGWRTIGRTQAAITIWGRLLTSTRSHRRHGKAKTRHFGLIKTDIGIWSATTASGVQTTYHIMRAETVAVTTSVLLVLPAPGMLHRCRKLTSVRKPPFMLSCRWTSQHQYCFCIRRRLRLPSRRHPIPGRGWPHHH